MARSPIWVHAHHRDHGWSGRLIPGRPERIHVHFPPDEGPLYTALGSTLRLGIAQHGMANAMQDDARLVKVDRRREDALECVFQLSDPRRLLREVRGAVIDQRPEHRRWLRVQPDDDHDVQVPVTLPDAPRSGQRTVGTLVDGSAGGVGLHFPAVAEPLLCTNLTMRARVPLPGTGGVGDWVCSVRYRAWIDDATVRYGLQFVSDGVAVDPPGPQLEPLWDCRHCGIDGLLADTHVRCPSCGLEASSETRRPTWRDQATAEVHPLCGIDVHCESCGVSASELATYCGHCGDRLPTEATEQLTITERIGTRR